MFSTTIGSGAAAPIINVKGTNDTSVLTNLPVLPSGLDPGLDHKLMGEDADPLNLLSTDKVRFGGTIDPKTGTVIVPGKKGLSDKLTAYMLGTGPRPKAPDQKLKRLLGQIDALLATGWKPSG